MIMNFSEIDTPFLWTDLDIMEKNILNLSSFFRNLGLNWRPHTKGIKIPAIAHMLTASGASGITCAKLSEAEVMAEYGIKNILIANQIVGYNKIDRVALHSKKIGHTINPGKKYSGKIEIIDIGISKKIN